MASRSSISRPVPANAGLRNYYWTRGLVAAAWVATAFTAGKDNPILAAIMLVAYPAWDAAANLYDGAQSGGLARNRSQAINVMISGLAALAIFLTLNDTRVLLEVFGAWAIVAGLLQLATGISRWKKVGAQWVMVLSGAQSALAGGHFIYRAIGGLFNGAHGILDAAPYAALGAFYFLVSAVWLTVRGNR